jgi:hypothetical protein
MKTSKLEELLGHRFRDAALPEAVLTPPSAGLPGDNHWIDA